MIQYNENNITVFQSSLFMTTSTVINTDEAVIIIDPTWLPNEVTKIRNYVDKIKKGKSLYVIFTHSDFDHILGSGAFPEATVIASKELQENNSIDEVMKQIDQFDQRFYLKRDYKPVYPRVDIVISEDGQTVKTGNINMTFYLAPGHTNDGLFTIIEPLKVFLAGDYLSNVEFPFIFDNYYAYLHTLNKAKKIMLQHDISLLIPGHGSTTESKVEMDKRLYDSIDYLERLPNECLEDLLAQNYPFFDGMKNNHINNKKIALKEINKRK